MAPSSFSAQVLIDGYNIIGAWSRLAAIRDQDGLEAARDQLIEALTNYSAFNNFGTFIIFDAYRQTAPGTRNVITQHLSVQYTDFGQTADSYIEKQCAQFYKATLSPSPRLIVATSDRAQQLTVLGYGAEWMSAQQLSAAVALSTQHIKQHQKHTRKYARGWLMNNLDPGARERLMRMRHGVE
ncbi:hypothetical protein XM38_016010 [Halomicronema hongdechloris C2206]|uniref:RNA-binding protein n=1 Tax=Halomicronema hongdechloris C2206 TaxID=1641165 RepID=A0A1Z3HK27_9CYAN|nr:NYN domain-containing protein [Halomicronema hongdechloris]ASC70660.1 hypothetical protein XM38_016010 [Halomicronema hongdechloris C2206]